MRPRIGHLGVLELLAADVGRPTGLGLVRRRLGCSGFSGLNGAREVRGGGDELVDERL